MASHLGKSAWRPYIVIANFLDWQLRNLLGEEIWEFKSHTKRDELYKKIFDRAIGTDPVLQKNPVIVSIVSRKLIVELKSDWYMIFYFYMPAFYFAGEIYDAPDGVTIGGRCRYYTFIRIWFLLGYNVALVMGLILICIALFSLINGKYDLAEASLVILLLLPLVVIGWYGLLHYPLFLRGAARARRKRLHDVIAHLIG